MKKLSLLFIVLLLSGCGLFKQPVPIVPKFPEAVPELLKKCEELRKVDVTDKVAITDLLKVIVQNYTLYYECSTRVEGWQDWYSEQRKIFENIKTK